MHARFVLTIIAVFFIFLVMTQVNLATYWKRLGFNIAGFNKTTIQNNVSVLD